MRPAITRAILFVVCAAGSSGCFTSHVLVTVRPDGSGPVEQTATIRPADLPAFDKLASPDLAANAQNPSDIAKQFQKDVGKGRSGLARWWKSSPAGNSPDQHQLETRKSWQPTSVDRFSACRQVT
ncbi:MAG TPA: hypothetical protein VFT39_25610 [Vicinamibacterales bacterium]|nr:hypothetical protein [Vicinamibacterales bacterium]